MDINLIGLFATAGSALEAARESFGVEAVQWSMIGKVQALVEEMIDIEVRGHWPDAFPREGGLSDGIGRG